MARAQTRLPVWPLVRALRNAPSPVVLDQDDPNRRALQRGILAGELPLSAADRLAVRLLGRHPAEVWPEWFDLDQYPDR